MKKKSFGVLGWVVLLGVASTLPNTSSSSRQIIQSIRWTDVDVVFVTFFQLIGWEASRAKDHEKAMLLLGIKCVVL